ncbi:hypothetical protein HMPREF9603_00996 [Cutibacterium acnes HL001PA1]|nr:hypothetical protein HMPREF9603_00996 [Cutibacterium acnes HL001PA1]
MAKGANSGAVFTGPIIHIADGLSVYDARTHLDRELNHEPLWE